MQKKHQVVMLPTEKESNLFLIKNNNMLIFDKDYHNTIEEIWFQDVYLYILSDEEIKEGTPTWVIDTREGMNNFIHQITQNIDGCKKIIATTNPELARIFGEVYPITGESKLYIPSIPTDFIQDYVKAYNEGKPIKEVMLEYKSIKQNGYAPNIEGAYIDVLKLRDDNTVIITHFADEKTYTEQDMKKAFEAGQDQMIYFTGQGWIRNGDFTDWFDKNYPNA